MPSDAPDLTHVYDVSVLLEHSVGDAEFAEELLERFHGRLHEINQSLRTHVNNGQLQDAARVAHSLKGEAGIMAAGRLHEVAARLEHSLRTPSTGSALELLDQLSDAVEQCLNADPAARQALNQIHLERQST